MAYSTKDKLIQEISKNPFVTNKELAEKYDITVQTVRNYLSQENINLQKIRKIAINQLLDLAEENNFRFDWSELEDTKLDIYPISEEKFYD